MVRPATDQPVCGATALSGRDILSWKRGPVSVQPPGACGDGEKDAGAITPRAATPGTKRCGGYHGFSAALLKP